MLKLEHIYKSFGKHDVLNDISLHANKGEVIALLGRSGAGKSTLLQCANLLIIPDKGEISLEGEALSFVQKNKTRKVRSKKQLLQFRQKISMVFQHFNLWQHKTAIENIIEAPIHVLKQSPALARAEAEHLLKKVGLWDKRDTYPKYLSGGQQQRIAIARALAMKPNVLLMDEPTSALDPQTTQDVLNVVKTIAKEGTTLLLATHEIAFARDIADRILFMEQGNLVAQGETQAMFFDNYSHSFTQFIRGETS